ncbi:SDR family oxidoreductase, partial [Bacillus sp. S34]|nr:SDR family oxidoreductase [Bacillus sp. S34]
SMGLTPLEGLVMGTRSGDLDPAVLIHLHREAGLSFDELDTMLNKESGLLGLTGNGDMRDVQDAALHGDDEAEAALAVYRHRIRRYVGAYTAQLGGLDALVLVAGHQQVHEDVTEQSTEDFDRTMKVNLYSLFWLVRAAVPHMAPGSAIETTSS